VSDNDLDLEVKAHSFQDYVNENKKITDVLLWVWKVFLSGRSKRIVKEVLGLTLVANLLGVLTSYYAIRSILDGLFARNLNLLVLGFASLGFLHLVVRFVKSVNNIRREYFFADFGYQMNEKVSRLFFEKSLGTHTSEDNILNEANISRGFEGLRAIIVISMVDLPDLLITLSVAFVVLWFVDPVVALIVTFFIAFHLVWSGLVNYMIMTVGYPIEKKWRFLTRFRKERMKGVERMKTNAKEEEELENIRRYYNEAIVPDLKLWIKVFKLWWARGTVSIFIYLGALIYGVRQIWLGELSPGFIYPMFTLATQIFDNLWKMGDLERLIHYNLWAAENLKEALNLPVGLTFKENAIVLPANSPCRIEFNSVSYRFKDDNSPLVLSDISFTVEPEEKVAIVGTSGAGKSTLTKLLLRYMDPTGGSIKIDGHDLRDIDLNSWLNLVGYISQTPHVWNDTVRGNALYGVPASEKATISDEYLWEQAGGVQVDFGERLVNGLDTVVGERGIKLSGGQNQRLMILAAIMKNPRFMIVDEATSSLDSSTEKLVQAGLEKALSRNCGALIIAHRLSTVRRLCNKFIVIEPVNGSGGKIVGIGRSFEELFETCPQFRKLADDQEIRI